MHRPTKSHSGGFKNENTQFQRQARAATIDSICIDFSALHSFQAGESGGVSSRSDQSCSTLSTTDTAESSANSFFFTPRRFHTELSAVSEINLCFHSNGVNESSRFKCQITRVLCESYLLGNAQEIGKARPQNPAPWSFT